MKRVRKAWVVSLSLAFFSVLGCGQTEGETCQVDRDCSSGLICCRGGGAVRGACHEPSDSQCALIRGQDSGVGSDREDASMSMPEDDAGG